MIVFNKKMDIVQLNNVEHYVINNFINIVETDKNAIEDALKNFASSIKIQLYKQNVINDYYYILLDCSDTNRLDEIITECKDIIRT